MVTITKIINRTTHPFTFVQVARGAVRQVVELEQPATKYAGVRGYCYNDARHALAVLITFPNMRPYDGPNLEALINHLLVKLGAESTCVVAGGFNGTDRVTFSDLNC